MTSTSSAFDKARAEDRAALIGYLPAGYPTVDGSIRAMQVMVEAGCDAIEIGLPYSDPVEVAEPPVGDPDTAPRTDDATPVQGTGSGEGREQL